VIASFENRGSAKVTPSAACCQVTEACLLQQLRRSAAPAAQLDAQIHSEDEAHKWLADGAAPASDITIRYAGELKRPAVVRRADGTEENWQYLYDCWRNTGNPFGSATAH
jgi:hypothetical protein